MPPILLLAFVGSGSDGGERGEVHREAVVTGTALDELGVDALSAALEASVTPPDADGSRPFFEDVKQARRR